MQLKFKKQSTYDTTPGTITFNTSTSQIGVGTEDGVVTMGGGDISKIRWDANDSAGTRGSLSAGDMAIAQEFGSNRFYFYDPSKIDVEYSRDGGKTWLDYGAPDEQKFNLTSTKGLSDEFYIGKWVSGETFNSSWRLRITFNNPIGNNEIYGSLSMFIINASTNGATGTHITLKGYNGNDQLISTYIESNWSGWSGYNSYYPNTIMFGGSSSQLYHCFKLEFEFWVDNYTGTSAPLIYNIFAYGSNLWNYKNSLINWGHLYKIDINKNACFPSSLYVNNSTATANKLLSSSEVDSKIEDSWTWGEYD